jgi:uncharacterized protein YecT (DUF1311 family)
MKPPKETEAAGSALAPATRATILVAVIGAVATGLGTVFTSMENLRLEEAKHKAAAALAQHEFETKLIFRAIEQSDASERIRNLKFFLEAGFLTDPEGKIKELKPDQYPSKDSPSFDCLQDKDAAAQIVCGSPGLAAKDKLMAALYNKLIYGAEENKPLIAAQIRWLADRNSCTAGPGPVGCMASKYDMRISQLQDLLAARTAGAGRAPVLSGEPSSPVTGR